MDHRYKETFKTWDKVASLYEEKFMNLTLYNDSYDFICKALPKKNSRILEVGCGPGNITKYMLTQRPDFDILGTDIAPNMIALAKKNNPTASFKIMDGRETGKLLTKCDAVICGFYLPYLSALDSENLIAAAKNLLNDNGLLYLSFVEGDPEKSDFQISSTGDRVYFYYHRLADVKSQLLNHSFENLKVFKVQYERSKNEVEIHTILVAQKKLSSQSR